MKRYFKVVKPGIMTTGWVGEYVCNFGGHMIILRFPGGKELKYLKSSLMEVNSPKEKPDEEGGVWIVVKESAKKGSHPAQFKFHTSEESARNEAIRLATENPNHAFRYYKQCGRVEYKAVTTFQLQES